MWNMMNDMCGISYFALSGLGVSRLHRFAGLHPALAYSALSGLTITGYICSSNLKNEK